MRILNIGCGNQGFGSNRIDLVRTSTTTELATGASLPYKDQVFDGVYGRNVLEHMPNALNFLLECRRVLRPGGELMLRTDNAAYLGWYAPNIREPEKYHAYHGNGHGDAHYAIYAVSHIRNLMRAADMDTTSVSLFATWKVKSLLAKVIHAAFPQLYCPHIWVRARRPT